MAKMNIQQDRKAFVKSRKHMKSKIKKNENNITQA